jgi:hypothetical protein
MSSSEMYELQQKQLPPWARAVIYIAELLVIYLISVFPHELLGHALPLLAFGYGVAEVGFIPPLGAYVSPAVPLETIVNPFLFFIVFGGVIVDISQSLIYRQAELHLDRRYSQGHKLVAFKYDVTPLAINFFRLFSIVLAGNVITNAIPIVQLFFQPSSGWSFALTPSNDGSTYLALTILQGDVVGLAVGIVTIVILFALAIMVILGLVRYIWDEIRDIMKGNSGAKKEKKNRQQVIKYKVERRLIRNES